MNTRTLGVLALAGAPGMALGLWIEQQYKPLADSWFTGVWGIIYITAWMCSMIALRRLKIAGSSRFGQGLVNLMLGTLTIANVSNVWQFVAPTNKSWVFWSLDMFWPLSNVLMLVYGIVVITANRVTGWKRLAPLFCGLWFPTAMATRLLPTSEYTGLFVLLHSTVAWGLLAFLVLTASPVQERAAQDVVPA
ncbi:hypothetical protein GCM10027341_04210 [Spirosoma knui]